MTSAVNSPCTTTSGFGMVEKRRLRGSISPGARNPWKQIKAGEKEWKQMEVINPMLFWKGNRQMIKFRTVLRFCPDQELLGELEAPGNS